MCQLEDNMTQRHWNRTERDTSLHLTMTLRAQGCTEAQSPSHLEHYLGPDAVPNCPLFSTTTQQVLSLAYLASSLLPRLGQQLSHLNATPSWPSSPVTFPSSIKNNSGAQVEEASAHPNSKEVLLPGLLSLKWPLGGPNCCTHPPHPWALLGSSSAQSHKTLSPCYHAYAQPALWLTGTACANGRGSQRNEGLGSEPRISFYMVTSKSPS